MIAARRYNKSLVSVSTQPGRVSVVQSTYYASSLAHEPRFRNHVRSQSSKAEERASLSRIWAPSGGIASAADEDGHFKLIRAGFLRQAHSGIFHMLPLGRRVQDKIEKLIDKHMHSLGASRLDLSSVSSQELWARSGRLSKIESELFLFRDRKDAGYLLSPTHEEEITSLVSSTVKSYKELPIKLYQISRKYRDELRPRHGLLRSREFVMKDLYTFDVSLELALQTYHAVRQAYRALFDELRVPYLMAEADSGDMGGNLSHEFHFPTSVGEDHVISCCSCDYVANEELAESHSPLAFGSQIADLWTFVSANDSHSTTLPTSTLNSFTVWRGISRDRSKLVNIWHALGDMAPNGRATVNTHAVKILVPDLDSGAENTTALWGSKASEDSSHPETPAPMQILNLVDPSLPSSMASFISSEGESLPIRPEHAAFTGHASISTHHVGHIEGEPSSLLRIRNGDFCPRCHLGALKVEKAIELGHTFFLGTRYSEPLSATVSIPSEDALQKESLVPMQMGCHGIGVSRMIGAVAETLSDKKGLNWPRVIAPYEVVIVSTKRYEEEVGSVYDELVKPEAGEEGLDAVIDDRVNPFSWKMNDADLVGYPVIIVLGRAWGADRACEVQCRRLGVKTIVEFGQLRDFTKDLLSQM